MTGIGCNYTSNTCRDNVLKIINDLKLKKYDFIALQEASNLYNELKNKDNYEIIFYNNNKFNPNDKDSTNKLITLYDSNKYRLLTKRYGIIGSRPFHLLFLKDINNNNKIIFINLHNVHYDSRTMLLNNIKLQISTITNLPEDVYIIIGGDFNDVHKKYYNGLEIEINNKKYLVRSINDPPKTCCETSFNLIGDYILYSENFNVSMDNRLYPINNNIKTSDHYPVHIHLDCQAQTPTPAPAPAPAPLSKLNALLDQYFKKIKKIDK
jgi:hypothetical protein